MLLNEIDVGNLEKPSKNDRQPVAMIRECVVSQFLEPPFLVSGMKSRLIMVKKRGGIVRTAIREDYKLINTLMKEIVSKVEEMGSEFGWGNRFPYSKEGLRGAAEYVLSFGNWDGGIEMINNSGEVFESKIPVVVEKWVPNNTTILVTKNRSYLGDLYRYGDDMYSILVHNPSRAMAILMKPKRAKKDRKE